MKNPLRRKSSGEPPFEYGTVPYHQHYARFYRRNRRWFLSTPLGGALVILSLGGGSLWTRVLAVFYILLSFVVGMRWESSTQQYLRHARAAWETETNETVQGMINSGLYSSPMEVVEAMKEAPPPGWKAETWREANDAFAAELRRHLEER